MKASMHLADKLVMRSFATASLVALSMLSFGCKGAPPAGPAPITNSTATGTPASQPAQGQQGTLNPDGTFTPNPVQPARQPAPSPSAQAAEPARAIAPAPAVSSAPAVPVFYTVPAGTRVAVTITESLSASRNNVGDGFTGVLAESLAAGGHTAFARGTRVAGTVVAAKGRGRFKGAGALGIELTSIGREHVSSSEYEKEQKGRGKRSAGFIGGGAGLGALIGGLAGGGKGAAIGALAGAGGGTAAAGYSGNRDVIIPSESLVVFRLNSPLRVR